MNLPKKHMREGIYITHGVNINIKPLEVPKTEKKHRVTNKDISSYLIKSKHKSTIKDRIKAHLLNNKTVKKIYRKKKKSHKHQIKQKRKTKREALCTNVTRGNQSTKR